MLRRNSSVKAEALLKEVAVALPVDHALEHAVQLVLLRARVVGMWDGGPAGPPDDIIDPFIPVGEPVGLEESTEVDSGDSVVLSLVKYLFPPSVSFVNDDAAEGRILHVLF